MSGRIRALALVIEIGDEIRVVAPDEVGLDLIDGYRRLLLNELAQLDMSYYPEGTWDLREAHCRDRLRCSLPDGHSGLHQAPGGFEWVNWDDFGDDADWGFVGDLAYVLEACRCPRCRSTEVRTGFVDGHQTWGCSGCGADERRPAGVDR